MNDDKYIVPGKYFSWEIIDQVTAIKHADKTFVNSCSTGVPQKIKSFFDAEDLSYGEEKKLTMISDNKEYDVKIKVEKNHNQMKLYIDSSFLEVIAHSYTEGSEYPAFIIQWREEGKYFINAMHTLETTVPKNSYFVDVAYDEIDTSGRFSFDSKEEVLNKCFGLNVKTVQEDVFYLSNSISVCFMNDTDWIHNNFINNNGIDLRKDCYLFDDTQEKIRFVGLFEKSENDSLKYSCIANKVDLSKFAKQKEHRNKRLAKKIPMDVLKRKAVEHDHALAKKEDKEGIITIRDPYVAEYTKRRAHGRCQLCGAEAPFIDNNGDPYLESHHVVWLSQGGEDSIHNTVALCPNCHRRVHILKNAEDIEKLKKILAQD